jgi:hypothetical protein
MLPTAVLVVLALFTLPPLLYLPGMLVARRLLPCADLLTCTYERVAIGALLHGWLALVLASFGVFALWLHLGLVLVLCGVLAPGALRGPRVAFPRTGWREAGAFALLGVVALVLVLPPFEAVLGARDAGVYANTGFAIARTGGIVQFDPLLAEMAQQAQSADPHTRAAAEQAMNHFLVVQHPERFIATRLPLAFLFTRATHRRAALCRSIFIWCQPGLAC